MGKSTFKKLFLSLVLGFFVSLVLTLPITVYADPVNFEPVTEAQFVFGGQILRLDSPAIKVNKLIYIPLRDFKDLFRFKMFENPKSSRLELTRLTDGLFVSFKQNSDVALLKQNSAVPMQAPMYFLRNTYYVPAKSFFELMGFDLESDSNIYRVFVKVNQINLTPDSIEIKGLAPFANQVTPLEKGQGFMVRIEGASWSGAAPQVEASHPLIKEVLVQAWMEDQKKKGIQVIVYGKTPLKYVVINEETENAVLIAISKDHYYANNFLTPAAVTQNQPVEQVDPPTPLLVKKQMIEKENRPVIKVTTTGEQTFPSLNALWLPDLTGNTGLAFMIKGEKMTKPVYEVKNQVVYLEAKSFLSPVNYRMEVQPDQKTINIIRVGTIEETVITFDLVNNRLNKKYVLLSPPYQKNGKWYLPVVDTCRHLGLGGRYEKNTNTVFINPRVKEVYVENVNGQKKVVIVATDTIFDQKVYESEKKDKLIIDLPHTHLDVPSNLLPFDDPSISKIRIGQFEADTVRVVIELKAPLTYGLGSKPSGRALEIGFANWITDIKWEATPDNLTVKIKATAPLKYSQNYYKNPDRFIMEFQEAVLKTQPLQIVGQFGLQQIRSSQFSYAPLTSRIVFDLDKYQALKVTEANGGKELTVLFTAKSIPETPVSPTHETTLSVYGGSPFNPTLYSLLKGKKIVVSAGHGGTDPGSIFGGTEEKVFTLQVSNKLKELLLKVGAIPLMAREDDQFVSMEDRCRFANGNAADALVDVHFNSFIKEEISGTETYYYKNKDYPLAQKVHQEILKIFNRQDKGLKKAQMYTLNHTQMPGVLVEPLYLSNKDELNLIKEDINQEKLARAILEGLNEYFKNPVVAQ